MLLLWLGIIKKCLLCRVAGYIFNKAGILFKVSAFYNTEDYVPNIIKAI